MTLGRLVKLVGVALGLLAANVGISVLYMVVYGHLINPGHDEQYYRDHIQAAAPYCSIVAGIPLILVAGRWVTSWWGGRLGVRPVLIVWSAYALIDLAILLAAGITAKVWVLFAVSFSTKLAAGYSAAVTGRKRAEAI